MFMFTIYLQQSTVPSIQLLLNSFYNTFIMLLFSNWNWIAVLLYSLLILTIQSTESSRQVFHYPQNRRVSKSIDACTFTPCPPPKFHVFLESILGSWTTTTSSNDNNSCSMTSNVEEVMRSCGGAIQGMKEIEYPNSPFDRLYNNRADDGFLFFDCGSYINGPILMQKHDGDEIMNLSLVSSLSFTDQSPKRRCIVSTSPSALAVSLIKSSSNEVRFQDEVTLVKECPTNFCWNEEILCKMSSSTQPWMLQRARWEKYKSSNDDVNIDSMSTEDILSSPPHCWMKTMNNPSDVQSEALKSLSKTNHIACVIQIGGMVDNNVKAFLRCYNDEGKLCGVIFQTGNALAESQ